MIRNFAQEVKSSSLLDKYPDLLDSLKSKPEDLLRRLSPEDKHSLKLEMLSYLRQDPRKASAEINSLFSYIEERGGMSRIKDLIEEIHLIATDTESGRMAADVLKEYLESLGLNVSTHTVPGFGSEDFHLAVRNLVKTVRGIVSFRKSVVFNLTGGYKPEAAVMAVLAAESDIKQYYRHESSKKSCCPAICFRAQGEDEQMGFDRSNAGSAHQYTLLNLPGVNLQVYVGCSSGLDLLEKGMRI